MNTDYDIVVVGGGLVGVSLACALRESGLTLAVVEAAPLRTDTTPSLNERTIALAYGSRRIFESAGVWGEIEHTGVNPIEHIHVSHRGGFGVTRLHATEAGLPALGYVAENRVLGAALLKSLADVSGLDWFCPATMEELAVDADRASVTIRHGEVTRQLTARLVVGADGANSAVRRFMGIAAERTEYDQVAVVATVAAQLPHGNTAYERFTESGPLALLPMRQNRCAMVWSARAVSVPEMLGWDDGTFLDRLQERFGDRLGRFSLPGARASYPLSRSLVPEHTGARLVLIGNAAHTVHPVAGQGFNLGLRDVAVLAETLAQACRDGVDIGAESVLARYRAWRARDTRVTSAFTDGLIRVFSNEIAPVKCARGAGLVAVDVSPAIKRRLVRITSGLAGRLPRLARGLELMP